MRAGMGGRVPFRMVLMGDLVVVYLTHRLRQLANYYYNLNCSYAYDQALQIRYN